MHDNKFKEKYFEIQIQQLQANNEDEIYCQTTPIINIQLPEEDESYPKQLNLALKNFENQIKQTMSEIKMHQANMAKKIESLKSSQLSANDVLEISKELLQSLEPVRGTKALLNVPIMQKLKRQQ